MTIYEVKQRTQTTSPHFFSRSTMKFFHQTLKDFSVTKYDDERYYISAPMKDHRGKVIGRTKRYFNTNTNNLEFVKD